MSTAAANDEIARLGERVLGFYDRLDEQGRRQLEKRIWNRLDPLARFQLTASEGLLDEAELALVDQLRCEGQVADTTAVDQTMAVTLITKATRLCNLRCTYCNDWAVGPNQSMSFETMARVTSAVLSDPTHASVTFLWHGGEPTLLGQRWFERALLVQAMLRRPGQVVRNELQTNATRVTPGFAEFASRTGITLGASIDGPPEVHNRTRLYANGKPSWADVRSGLRVLEEHGHGSSVLMVVDQEILDLGAQSVFDALVAEGISGVGLLAAKPSNQPDAGPATPTDHYVTPDQAARFIIELDACRREAGIEFSIREADDIIERLGNTQVADCTLGGDCVGQFFIVEPNGEIAHCDNFLGDSDYEFGNITTQTFAEIRSSEKMRRLVENNRSELAAMSSCPGFEICQGWCPHERYTSRRHNPDHDPRCCGRLPLIDHFKGIDRPRRRLGSTVAVAAPTRR